jgi:NAD-dependent SIR2 family protein deacetylase
VDVLRSWLEAGEVAVLSGAGLSTDSGIPDYRGPSGALRRHAPMQYGVFVTDAAARHRYWARSYLGWRSIATARPNAGHRAVAALQATGRLSGIITQNVDGLHQAGGAMDVIELHGGLDRVVCLDCQERESRFALDARLRAANPNFDAHVASVNPDGDADLHDGDLAAFRMVRCRRCGGDMLKPDVVFFGESVPKPRVAECFSLVDRSRTLLVLGSSLTVMSGFRFARRAAKLGIRLAIVNQGPTRGDDLADLRVDAPLADVLPAVV